MKFLDSWVGGGGGGVLWLWSFIILLFDTNTKTQCGSASVILKLEPAQLEA